MKSGKVRICSSGELRVSAMSSTFFVGDGAYSYEFELKKEQFSNFLSKRYPGIPSQWHIFF